MLASWSTVDPATAVAAAATFGDNSVEHLIQTISRTSPGLAIELAAPHLSRQTIDRLARSTGAPDQDPTASLADALEITLEGVRSACRATGRPRTAYRRRPTCRSRTSPDHRRRNRTRPRHRRQRPLARPQLARPRPLPLALHGSSPEQRPDRYRPQGRKKMGEREPQRGHRLGEPIARRPGA